MPKSEYHSSTRLNYPTAKKHLGFILWQVNRQAILPDNDRTVTRKLMLLLTGSQVLSNANCHYVTQNNLLGHPPVPEPSSTLSLLVLGAMGAGYGMKRKRRLKV